MIFTGNKNQRYRTHNSRTPHRTVRSEGERDDDQARSESDKGEIVYSESEEVARANNTTLKMSKRIG